MLKLNSMDDFDIVKDVFENLSPVIGEYQKKQIELIIETNSDIKELLLPYMEYCQRDNFYPRPILTFFGYVAKRERISWNMITEISDIILLSQYFRDFLAIHDDIVDEDDIKFGKPTLPIIFSDLSRNKLSLNKRGKDLSLFLGDFIFSIANDLILNSKYNADKKNKIQKLFNDSNKQTQIGQIKELLFEKENIYNISTIDILEMYSQKAANYCYVFPFELGLILGDANSKVIKNSRTILSKIGVASQILDDILGVFPIKNSIEKITMGEILNLRRTILLIELAKIEKNNKNSKITKILSKKECTTQEANIILSAIKAKGIVNLSLNIIRDIVKEIKLEIENIEINSFSKQYLKSLIQFRIIDNLNKIIITFKKGDEYEDK